MALYMIAALVKRKKINISVIVFMISIMLFFDSVILKSTEASEKLCQPHIPYQEYLTSPDSRFHHQAVELA